MNAEAERRAASLILHSLADSGQPPKLGASRLNVGTERFLTRLRSEYLEGLLPAFEGADGGGTCKWIEADYGNGKTQFLRCTQELAWEQNFVTAFVELSQDECPLDRPDLVYSAIARAVQARPETPADVDRSRGLDRALEQLFDRYFPGVLSGSPNDDLIAQAREWVDHSLPATPVESTSFTQAVVLLLRSQLDGDAAAGSVARQYLRGEPVPSAELKSHSIYEKLDKTSGFRLLRSMCQLLQRSGLATGTALLFDEARRSLSLMSSKSQKIACENLLTVINKCNSGDLPGTLFLYAVMPEFFTDFADRYAALQQRCGPGTRYKLNTLQGINELDLLQQIGQRILSLFDIAHPAVALGGQEPATHAANLKVVAEHALRVSMGGGTRRLMVKTWTQLLNDMVDTGVRKLSAADVESVITGVRQELATVDAAGVSDKE